jgi:hypothetical protein
MMITIGHYSGEYFSVPVVCCLCGLDRGLSSPWSFVFENVHSNMGYVAFEKNLSICGFQALKDTVVPCVTNVPALLIDTLDKMHRVAGTFGDKKALKSRTY